MPCCVLLICRRIVYFTAEEVTDIACWSLIGEVIRLDEVGMPNRLILWQVSNYENISLERKTENFR